MPEIDDTEFELLPLTGLEPEPQEQLAESEALLDPDQDIEETDDPPEPYGRSWLFDPEKPGFLLHGTAPATTNGVETLKQWILIMMWTARMSLPIYSDDFGMDEPARLIGQPPRVDLWQAYETDLTDALLVHDRITEVEYINLHVDEEDPEVTLVDVVVQTDDEERITIEGFPVAV